MMSTDIGIDLGTASILVYIKGKGVVLKEPSVVAFDRDTNKIKAIGEEARLMLGRTPGNIVAVRPLRQGVISDYTVTEKMIKYFIQKALGKKTFRKPRSRIAYFIVVTLLLLNNTQMGNPLLLMVVGINLFYEAEEEKKEPEAIETESENTNDSVHQEA